MIFALVKGYQKVVEPQGALLSLSHWGERATQMTERNGILKIYFLQLLITTVKNEQQYQLVANNLTTTL